MRILIAAIVVWIVIGGCASHTRPARVADVAKGDYYTSEEIKGLSQEERDRYCRALDDQIAKIRFEAARYDLQADSLKLLSDSLRTANSKLTSQIRDLDNEIRQLRLARRSATTYVVKAGDTLQTISSAVFGTPDRWREIFEANKGSIATPDSRLVPGLRLVIPSK